MRRPVQPDQCAAAGLLTCCLGQPGCPWAGPEAWWERWLVWLVVGGGLVLLGFALYVVA